MKILITGSSGYLGRNTVMKALKRGHAVRGFDIKASGITHHAYRETVADITDPDAMAKAARGTDAVFHLAAALAQFERDERRMHRVNVGGTANVLSAAAKLKVRKVVFISSVEACPNVKMRCQAAEVSRMASAMLAKVSAMTE